MLSVLRFRTTSILVDMERSILTPSRRSILRLFPSSRRTAANGLNLNFKRRNRLSEPSSSPRIFASSAHTARTRRYFHSSRVRNDSTGSTDIQQAYPLSGYYSDLLSFHYPQYRSPAATATTAAQSVKEDKGRDLTKEEKMSIVFGTRLAGPGYESTSRYNPETMAPESTWKTINGVPIPPRPTEPDNCCMSGCVHCVWDDFRDDLEHWASRVNQAHAKATNTNTSMRSSDMRQGPRSEVASASISMDDDGGGSEANWEMPSATGGEDLFAGIPVGIKEFMKIEKKLREKKQQQQ
jgi:Oxidoreductase-like protein, N-terminal